MAKQGEGTNAENCCENPKLLLKNLRGAVVADHEIDLVVVVGKIPVIIPFGFWVGVRNPVNDDGSMASTVDRKLSNSICTSCVYTQTKLLTYIGVSLICSKPLPCRPVYSRPRPGLSAGWRQPLSRNSCHRATASRQSV